MDWLLISGGIVLVYLVHTVTSQLMEVQRRLIEIREGIDRIARYMERPGEHLPDGRNARL